MASVAPGHVAYLLLFLPLYSVGCLRTVALPGIAFLAPARFRSVFWMTEAAGLPLNFLVVWEVFRQVFPKGSYLRRLASKGFILAGFALAVFLIDAFGGFKAYTSLQFRLFGA